MPRIPNFNRNQSFIFCPDDYIPEDSPVRILDAFVNSLNLEELGYITFASSAPGQQPYSRFDLIKLHLYGYINGIRSSRKLAAECSRNIELMWLINGISPSKSLISDFVKVNETAIQNTFKEFVLFLKFAGFVDNKAIVIDGTKIRAQNSRNKYYSIKKIDSTIEYFESQIKHYTYLLKKAEVNDLDDKDIDENAIIPFKEKIDNYQKKVEQFTEFKKNMKDQKLSQITLTDPDSRMMTSHGNSDISYNMQTAVDAKNSLIVTTDVVSDINDTNQLENMVDKAEEPMLLLLTKVTTILLKSPIAKLKALMFMLNQANLKMLLTTRTILLINLHLIKSSIYIFALPANTLLLKETFREGLTKLMLKQLLLATNIFVLTVPVALIFTSAPILLMAEELQETLIKIS